MRRLIVVLLLATAALIVALVAPLDIYGESRIYHAIDIARPPDVVFAFVTTPLNWAKYHPATRAVSTSADHSLAVGEQVLEEFEIAGRRGRALWTVIEREPARRWVIDGAVEGGGSGRLTYRTLPQGEATRFEREFVYPRANLMFAILDVAVLRPKMTGDAEQALVRAKQILESS